MLAMLRKDCHVMWKFMAVYTITWMVMTGTFGRVSGTSADSLYYLMPVMSSTIVLSAISNDEACRWDRFIAMTPLRPWQIVLAKYLFAYGTLTLLSVLGALAGRVSASGRGGAELLTEVVLVLLATTLALPLVYRFGRQTGGRILIIIILGFAVAILGPAHLKYEWIDAAFGWIDDVPVPALAAGIVGLLLALHLFSFLLSVRFYTRRQRGRYD